jgi:hypothetical protein
LLGQVFKGEKLNNTTIEKVGNQKLPDLDQLLEGITYTPQDPPCFYVTASALAPPQQPQAQVPQHQQVEDLYSRTYKLQFGSLPPANHINRLNLLPQSKLTQFIKSPLEQLKVVNNMIVRGLQSTTKARIVSSTPYLLDGILGTGGQAVVYSCFKGAQLLCAKSSTKTIIDKEKDISERLKTRAPWCRTVIHLIDVIKDGDHHIAVIPYLPFILSNLPLPDDPTCLDEILVRVSICMLAAILAFQQAELVHNDIKSANIGCTTDRIVVLFDYGSASDIGGAVLASTPGMGYGVNPGSTQYDLACLANTLANLCGLPVRADPSIEIVKSAAQNHAGVCSIIIPLLLDACQGENSPNVHTLALQMRSMLPGYVEVMADFDSFFPE